MIRGERPLSVVLPIFLDWLITTTSDVSSATGTLHYPGLTGFIQCSVIVSLSIVLVAHNGFSFDFPILLAEVERRPEVLNVSLFGTHRIHFTDTLPLLRQVAYLYKVHVTHVISHRCRRMGTKHSKGRNWVWRSCTCTSSRLSYQVNSTQTSKAISNHTPKHHRCSQGPRGCAGYEGSSHPPFPCNLPFQAPVSLSQSAAEVMGQSEVPIPAVHLPHQILGQACHHSCSGKEACVCWVAPHCTGEDPL